MTTLSIKDCALSAIKTFTGMEGQGFNANLTLAGQKVAFARDDGNGGCMHIDWVSDEAQKRFTAIIVVDYQLNDGHKRYEALMDMGKLDPQTPAEVVEGWINRAIDEAANKKRLDRAAKTKTLFRIEGDSEEELRTLKIPASDPRAVPHLRQKYGTKLIFVYGVDLAAPASH